MRLACTLVGALSLSAFATAASGKDFDFSQFFDELLDFNFDYAASFIDSAIDSKLYEFSKDYQKLICKADWTEVSYPEFGQFPPLKVREYYCDQEWYFERLKDIGDKLQSKFGGDGTEAAVTSASSPAILAEVESTLTKYKSETKGDLSLQLSYSLEYGVMRLKWKSQREVDSCPGFESITTITTQCDSSGQCKDVLETKIVSFVDFVFREPSYKVYRIVDGVPEEIASFRPVIKSVRGSLFQIENILKGIDTDFSVFFKDISKYVEVGKAIDKLESTDVLWYDSLPDLRPKGSTLSYRVVGHAGRLASGATCPEINNYQTEVSADADGNGMIDFVPDKAYSDLLKELYRVRNSAIAAATLLLMER